MKILQCSQNDVVVNFNDVIRIAHCALDIEATQSVANKKYIYSAVLFCTFKIAGLERFRF